MFRKLTIAAAAVFALSAVALAPTSASAWGKGGFGGHVGGHGFGWGPRLGIGLGVGLATAAIATSACMRQVVVDTPYGARVRWVNVCY